MACECCVALLYYLLVILWILRFLWALGVYAVGVVSLRVECL